MKSVIKKFVGVLCISMAILSAGISASNAQARIVNIVHVGGSDIEDPDIPETRPGFDKNYSLVAFAYADGTAAGKLIDRYAGRGGLGLKADIDCVHVAGNTAWVSGVVTQGQVFDNEGNPFSIVGWYARTRVQDNGDNNDPANPDRVAFTQFRSTAPFVCSGMFQSTFWDMPGGQVTIR